MVETSLELTVPQNGVVELRNLPAGRNVKITVQDSARQSAYPLRFGWLKGKVWMSPDFDAPLDDMQEYM